MKLINLSIRNIASYKEAKLNFLDLKYPVAVYGDNGAGKTTLFVDSITAALFSAAYGSKKLFKNICGRTGYGEIVLEFEIDNKRYKIIRRIYRDKTSEAYLYDERNIPIATSVRDVDEQIKILIGMDNEDFLNSIIIRQGEVEKFIDADEAERGKILLNILKLNMESLEKEVYEKIKDIDRDIKTLEGEIKVLESEIKKENEIKNNIKIFKEKIESLEKEKSIEEQKLGNLLENMEKLDTEIKELMRIIGSYEGLINELNEKTSLLNNLIIEKRRILNILTSSGIQEEYILSIAKNIYKIINLKSIKEKLYADIEKLDLAKKYINKIQKLYIDSEKLNKELSKFEKNISELKNLKTSLEVEIESCIDNLNKLETAAAKCPLCGASLTEEHRNKRILELKKTIELKREELNKTIAKLNEIETYYQDLKYQKETIDGDIKGIYRALEVMGIEYDIHKGIIEIDEKIRNLHEELIQIDKELKQIFPLQDKDLEKLLDLREEIEKYKELYEKINELKGRIEEIQDKVSKYEEDFNLLGIKQEKLKNLKLEIDKQREKIYEINKKISEYTGKITELNNRILEIDNMKNKLKKLKEKINELNIKKEAYEILKETFSWRGLPLTLLRRYLDIINKITNYYIELFNLPITLELRISEKAGKPTVMMKTYRDGIEAHPMTLSNGERVLLGFAIRLALNDIISGLYYRGKQPKFFIIDEGFGPLDADNRKKVAWALYNLLREGKYEQMIIISHAEGLWEEEIFKTRIEVYKEYGVSRINIQETIP